jgi:hypothetical protein
MFQAFFTFVSIVISGCCKLDLDVAYVFKCFRHFKPLFQVFLLDVAKVDLDVAYVTMTKYVCCKPMFQVFQVFHTYVANVLSGCFKSRSWFCTCYKWLYMHDSSDSFVLDVCCKCFNWMFQK